MNRLIEYYNNDNYEEIRLNTDRDNVHKIEFVTSMHFLKKHLPQGCTVLDCCAGTGVYALPLAENYIVTAGDLVPKHVELIKEKDKSNKLKEIYQGNILTDLRRFDEESFDAVLCMGALYHLQSEEERETAVTECLRVLKKGGIFAFAYINRNAIFINHLRSGIISEEEYAKVFEKGYNGLFYGMDFDEAMILGKKLGLKKITDVGVDGLMYPLYDTINGFDKKSFEIYMEYHLETCEQPSIIGHSMHGLWIGRKM